MRTVADVLRVLLLAWLVEALEDEEERELWRRMR